MIRQDTLAHFLFRHTVEPVVLLPLFVRLRAFLGLRELSSGRKREGDTDALNNTLDFFMPRHTIQRKARNYFSRTAGGRGLSASSFLSRGLSDIAPRDTVTQCYVLYRTGTLRVARREYAQIIHG